MPSLSPARPTAPALALLPKAAAGVPPSAIVATAAVDVCAEEVPSVPIDGETVMAVLTPLRVVAVPNVAGFTAASATALRSPTEPAAGAVAAAITLFALPALEGAGMCELGVKHRKVWGRQK